MSRYKTEQEQFWAGEFGDEYVECNQGEALGASNSALFAKILSRTGKIGSVIEFGACLTEYYNPAPVEVSYRGNRDRLFKRDFAGEMLDRFADLRLVDYGLASHRDNQFPQDDLTWFLLEKTGA